MTALNLRLLTAMALVLGSVSAVSAQAEPLQSPPKYRSIAILCLPTDITAAEKRKSADGDVRAYGDKHLVAFGVAIDTLFPHQSVKIFDPDNALPEIAIDYVGGKPPNMEIMGNAENRKAMVLFNLDNRNGAEESVVITFDGDSKPPQILSGTCTRELKAEAFDQLQATFEIYQAKWVKVQSK